MLQLESDKAHKTSTSQATSYSNTHDKKAVTANFAPGQQVLLEVRLFPNKNKNLLKNLRVHYWVLPNFHRFTTHTLSLSLHTALVICLSVTLNYCLSLEARGIF